MPRYAYGRDTCEGCASLDIRRLRQENLLQPGRRSGLSWSRNGEPSGSIQIEIEDGAALLIYRTRRYGDQEWRDIRQRVPIVWTACALGGRRPWFLCAVFANGRYCGRRAAILYAGGDLFACRHCYRLAYASQSESPRNRYLSQAQKLRMRLGGSPSLIDPFPDKPPRMHWRTYERLAARGLAAEGRSLELMRAYLDRPAQRGRRR
jgi:hypothetical protein